MIIFIWPSELLGRLGDFASSSNHLVHCFDDTNCVSHVTNIKATKRKIVRQVLNIYGLVRNYINDGSITQFQELEAIIQLFTRMVNSPPLGQQICKWCERFDKPAKVHSQYWSDLHDSSKSPKQWSQLLPLAGLFCYHQPCCHDKYLRYIINIEAHIVLRKSFIQSFTVHFNRNFQLVV